jgi:hypothetical protein
MSKQQDDFDKKMTELYQQYIEHCKEVGIATPASPALFARKIKEVATTEVAHKIAAKEMLKYHEGAEAWYVAMRVADLSDPVGNSKMSVCSQCGESVWVAADMANYRAKTVGIICNQCLPEITGKTREEIIKEKLEDIDA